ncbi:UvrD-helicase domain-containing protein [Candidatus Uhrbacteria bacterium]|nr:UvrD-helicase domain-containing protein [Candidatus Uhrbacteria bacterium]
MSDPNNLLQDLNPEQQQAVIHENGPLLIVAGAGTGKTTVVTRRLAWLALNGKAKTNEVLALTFTEKAAEEMEERVDRLLPYGYVDLWISTFHAFGERVLKNHALEIGIPNDFKLIDQTQAWLLIRKNLNKFALDYYRPLGNPTKFINALVRHFSRAKDEEIYPEEYLKLAEAKKLNNDSADEVTKLEIKRINEVANAYHIYQQLLLENNALDFGDLINYTLRLFRQRPHLLNRYRQQFKYILVDEFQDTNWAQYELVKMLAAPTNNLTVVADDDQSIYKFRGACLSNILTFTKDYPESKNVVLVNNYRSTQNILDLSYHFIQQNSPNRLEVTIDGLSKKLKASQGSVKAVGEIAHLHFGTENDEFEGVIKKIVELKEKDTEATFNDFAILVRANNQAEGFVAGLTRYGLPFQFLASQGLYNKPIVIDIISYLKLLDNYHESQHLYRIFNLPFLEFPASDLLELMYQAKKKALSLYQILHQYSLVPSIGEASGRKIEKVLSAIKRDSQLAREKGVTQIIMNFLQNFEYEGRSYLKYLDKLDPAQAKENLDYLNQFFKEVQQFEKEAVRPTVQEFLEFISLAIESGDSGALSPDFESGPETIKVTTVHSAKGLEFKYVFIVNVVDRRFPTVERSELIELPAELVKEILPEGDVHMEEERRLFYVAMTRAKRGLYFTSADDYGGARRKKLSRFLFELGLAKEEKESKPAKGEGNGLPVFNLEVAKKFTHVTPAIPTKFSFTQLRAFENCPWQYRYAHVIQIPIRGKSNFSFGKTMHSTLQRFFAAIKQSAESNQASLFATSASAQAGSKTESEPKIPALDDLLKIYEECWIDDWYRDAGEKEKFRDNGRRVLKEFYKKHNGAWPMPKYLEEGFSLKIGPYTLRGQIDRIDPLPDGTVEIIDYKTGNVPKDDNLDKDKKEQLWIYQIAASEILKEKVSKLTYYYLEENKAISFLGKPEDLTGLQEDIVGVIERIKKGEFAPTPSVIKCNNCDFKEICEYKTL